MRVQYLDYMAVKHVFSEDFRLSSSPEADRSLLHKVYPHIHWSGLVPHSYTENDIRVYVKNEGDFINEFKEVRLTEIYEDGAIGVIL